MLTDEQKAALTGQVATATLGKIWDEAYRLGMLKGCEIGFGMSGEGYNAEYPYGDKGKNFAEHSDWIQDRDEAIRATVT